MNSKFKQYTFLLLALAFIGCGGSSDEADEGTQNQPPSVEAGSNQTVNVNASITITGTASDSDGTISSYEWSKDGKVLATTASFIYTPTTVGTDTLTLTVVDNEGERASDSITVSVQAISVTTLSNGLLSYYKLEGNSIDSSGNGNDGTEVGVTNYSNGYTSTSNQAVSLSGDNNYVEIPNVINGLSQLTISSWFKYTDSNTWRWIYANHASWVDVGLSIASQHDTMRYHFKTTDASFGGSSVDGKIDDGSIKLVANTWYLSTYTYDGNQVKGYINGVLDFTKDISGKIVTPYTQTIGAGYQQQYFKGSIDEMRIYDRVLSNTEINALYQDRSTSTTPPVTSSSTKKTIVDHFGGIDFSEDDTNPVWEKQDGYAVTWSPTNYVQGEEYGKAIWYSNNAIDPSNTYIYIQSLGNVSLDSVSSVDTTAWHLASDPLQSLQKDSVYVVKTLDGYAKFKVLSLDFVSEDWNFEAEYQYSSTTNF